MSLSRLHAVTFAAIASACGPEAASGEGSQSGDGSSSADDDDDDDDDDRGENDDATASATLDGGPADATSAGETGDVTDMCLLGDPDACPDECGLGEVVQIVDDACGRTSLQMCTPGGPKPGLPASTWWAIGPAGPVFIEYGGSCSAAAQPAEWTECAGIEGEPVDCACFCQQGYCPGDEARSALDGCGLESPCAAVFVDAEFGAADHEAERCVLESLRDGVPGVYDVTLFASFSAETIRYYVFDTSVQRIVQTTDDVLTCPEISDWSGASTCALESSSYFEACLAPPPPGEECVLSPELWVTDCEDAPAMCG